MIVKIDADVNIGFLLRNLIKYGRTDMRPALRMIRKEMHADQRDHRDRQRGPSKAWAPLAPSTVALYAKRGYRRNRRILNRLPNARKSTVYADRVRLYSPVRWSMAHQDGPTRAGRGGIIPQRQYFWISRDLHRRATEILTRELFFAWLGLGGPMAKAKRGFTRR